MHSLLRNGRCERVKQAHQPTSHVGIHRYTKRTLDMLQVPWPDNHHKSWSDNHYKSWSSACIHMHIHTHILMLVRLYGLDRYHEFWASTQVLRGMEE